MRCTSVRFVDTNVLLYAISRNPAEEAKARIANDVLSSRDLALSTQVLQEFYVQATRPSREHPLTHEQAAALVQSFTRFTVQDVTLETVTSALDTRKRFGLSYWDSAIISSARELGCTELLSEDLSAGQDYDGVRVVNPFADAR